MLKPFVADLHIHSVLSPCAEVEMTPRNIVRQALRHNVQIIAITDHNSCDNVRAALEAAKGTDLTILPAMEVETKEEIHLIVLFEKMRQLLAWEQVVKKHLSGRLNDADKFGAQFVVDAEDNLLEVKTDMLLTSLSLSLTEVTEQVDELGGISIASHVDRPTYSILSQLGFFPAGIKLAAVEISSRLNRQEALKRIPSLADWPVVVSSDAHTIEAFVAGPKTVFLLKEPTLAEIRLALKGESDREVVCNS